MRDFAKSSKLHTCTTDSQSLHYVYFTWKRNYSPSLIQRHTSEWRTSPNSKTNRLVAEQDRRACGRQEREGGKDDAQSIRCSLLTVPHCLPRLRFLEECQESGLQHRPHPSFITTATPTCWYNLARHRICRWLHLIIDNNWEISKRRESAVNCWSGVLLFLSWTWRQ